MSLPNAFNLTSEANEENKKKKKNRRKKNRKKKCICSCHTLNFNAAKTDQLPLDERPYCTSCGTVTENCTAVTSMSDISKHIRQATVTETHMAKDDGMANDDSSAQDDGSLL